MPARLTDPDCTLAGKRFSVAQWPKLTPAQLAAVVATCEPDNVRDFDWTFCLIKTKDLREATQDGDEPEGGWEKAYQEHVRDDRDAVKNGSPEYSGRQDWLKNVWCKNTRIYPLFLTIEDGRYYLWDGHHRLAGAFHHDVKQVACILGRPKRRRPTRKAS